MDILLFVLVFAASFATDFIYTAYVRKTQTGDRCGASVLSSLLIILGSFTVYIFTHDWVFVIPEALGAFCGTWVFLTLEKPVKRVP